MQGSGAKLLTSIIEDEEGGLDKFVSYALKPEFFSGDEELEFYEYVAHYLDRHGTIPKAETVEHQLDCELPPVVEPSSYYLEETEQRYIHQKMKKGIMNAQELLKAQNPKEALKQMDALMLELSMSEQRQQVVNYTERAYDMIRGDYLDQWTRGDDYGIKMGWPTLDAMIGGLQPSDILVYVGAISTGKTYKSLYSAHYAWSKQKKTVLFVSMEMPALPLAQRLTALHTKIPAAHFKTAELDDIYKDKAFNALKGIRDDMPPFWLVDGNLTSTVEDICRLTKQLKPDAVYVDGAYLLQTRDRNKANWERVKQTAEGLKQKVAADCGVPVIATYQFNKEQLKAKNNKDGLRNIGGSDAIGQIATIVLGAFTEDSVEECEEQLIEVLKGRNGEKGAFAINWLFEKWPYMDFTEKEDSIHTTQDDFNYN